MLYAAYSSVSDGENEALLGVVEIRLFIKTNKQYSDCNAGIQGYEITTCMCTKGFINITAFVQ